MEIRQAIARIGSARLRLTDAVIIAAAALLLLKGVGFVLREPAPEPSAAGPGPSVVVEEPDLPAFARVLAFARAERPRPEVVTTGSNPEDGADGTPETPETGEAGDAPNDAAQDGLEPGLLPNLASPASPAQEALVARIGEQRDELERRLRDLDMREELLAAAERRLEERLGGQAPPVQGGGDPQAQARPAAEENEEALARLVSMYEAMRPKDAARVFDRLALEVLVPLVEAMNPRRMAEVMAMMSPESAERLTIALAMRARGMPLPGQRTATTQALPPTELPAIALPPRE
jgi:flagellar motility protein MotE (MotC chaperone)